MNNSNTPAPTEAGINTAPTAILALDLDILYAAPPSEIVAFVTHIATCAKAVGTTCVNARLPASVSVHVTRQLNADDAEWFASNPAREYRYREPMPGEYVLRICKVPPPFVLVRKLDTGARLLAPIWLKSDATTSVERFEAKRNQQQLDNDDVLRLLFDVYCAFPGEPLDVLNVLRAVGDHKWYRMVTYASRLLAPKAPAS